MFEDIEMGILAGKNAGMEVPEFHGEKDALEKKQLKERVLNLLDFTYEFWCLGIATNYS